MKSYTRPCFIPCTAYAITINITKKRIPKMMQKTLNIKPNMDRVVKTMLDALQILTYVFLFIRRKPFSSGTNASPWFFYKETNYSAEEFV